MRRTSITERMILYYILLSVSALTLIGYIFYYLAKDALMDRTFDQLTSVRVVKKRQIESFFMDRVNDLKLLSIMPEIKARIALLNDQKGSSIADIDSLKESDVLKSFINQNPYFEGIFLESVQSKRSLVIRNEPQNNSDASFISYSGVDRKIINDISAGITIFEKPLYFKEHEKTPYLYFVSEVRSDDSLLGYCSLILSFDGINKIMLENNSENGLGNTGESYLVGADRLMRSKSRFIDTSIYKVCVNTKGADEAFLGKVATSVFVDYNGNPVLSSYEKIDFTGLDWIILAEIDLAEADIPIIEFRNYIIFIIAMISISTFIVTYLISKRITDPIIVLTDATTKIYEGNYDERINVNTNDELQKLAETFNIMSEHLKTKEIELQQEKTKRISGVMDALESERERLSRDLHDSLGQSLIALKLQLENVETDDPASTKVIIGDVKSKIDAIIHEIRNMSNDLMPSVLKEFGLTTAIRNMCHEISSLSNFDINLNNDIRELELSQKISIYVFRIIQEGLNNIIKHAKPSFVAINVVYIKDILKISIKDDGVGFDIKSDYASKGNGLYYMRERVNLLNGSFKIFSEINNGTEINISIIIHKNG